MSEYWKSQNLEGNGLQTINQQYSRLKLNTQTAYLLCIFFIFGAHQFYLKSPSRGFLFLCLSTAIAIAFLISPLLASLIFLVELIVAIIDIKNMEDKIVKFNKNLKMSLSLQTNAAAPKNFMGRYHEDSPIDDYMQIKSNEITAFETRNKQNSKSRVYSFSEQEALLREMGQKKKETKEKKN